MPELPLELCEAIVDKVDSRSDLAALSRVSIKFNSAAERRLYRVIALPSSKESSNPFETITACPRIAARVIDILIIRQDQRPPTDFFAKIFISLPNLKHLRVLASVNIAPAFQTRAPFLLHSFYYTASHSGFTKNLEFFLENQVELRVLDFETDDPISLSPAALPKLTTIRGTGKFIREIVPGRPVTRAACIFQDEHVPFSGPYIRSLAIGSTTKLQWYTSSFSTLIFLQCAVPDYKDQALFPHLESLSALKNLIVLVANMGGWTEGKVKFGFVDPIFAGCISLSSIQTIGSKSMIWIRGSKTGTAVTWDINEWKKI